MSTKMKYPVITIGREYCANGWAVASGVANSLGIKYYDRDFVYLTVNESGYSEDVVRAENEAMSNASKFLDSMLNATAIYSSSFDKIFEAQKRVILDLAKEPCILVGHCANSILKEAGVNSFNVYLYGDIEARKTRCAELNPDIEKDNLEKFVRKVDENRAIYYKKYTGGEVDDAHNYNICLDVSTLGVDKTVEIILSLVTE